MPLKDKFDRTIDYVRIGVTDRCNLRCFYCMPESGIACEPKAQLLSFEEIVRLLHVLGELGFTKVRFTGGEPFLRKDFMQLLEQTHALDYYSKIRLTTNGTLIQNHIGKLKDLGINTINLSLDTLDAARFKQITRRDDYDKVIKTLNTLIEDGFHVKINAVVMRGINTEDILPLVALARHKAVDVRFIEEMPFNGGYKSNSPLFTAADIRLKIQERHPSLSLLPGRHGDTATNYTIENFKGTIGIIPAFSRTFCNTCNRLRITPKGEIKTCLYDGGVFNIRDYMRAGVTDQQLATKFTEIVQAKQENGFAAEAEATAATEEGMQQSMSTIGG